MKENLSSLNEVLKGPYLYGSKLLKDLVAAVFFLWSGGAVVLFTYQTAFESCSLQSSFPGLVPSLQRADKYFNFFTPLMLTFFE